MNPTTFIQHGEFRRRGHTGGRGEHPPVHYFSRQHRSSRGSGAGGGGRRLVLSSDSCLRSCRPCQHCAIKNGESRFWVRRFFAIIEAPTPDPFGIILGSITNLRSKGSIRLTDRRPTANIWNMSQTSRQSPIKQRSEPYNKYQLLLSLRSCYRQARGAADA